MLALGKIGGNMLGMGCDKLLCEPRDKLPAKSDPSSNPGCSGCGDYGSP